MEKLMARTRKEMERAAKELAFMEAARLEGRAFRHGKGAVANWPKIEPPCNLKKVNPCVIHPTCK